MISIGTAANIVLQRLVEQIANVGDRRMITPPPIIYMTPEALITWRHGLNLSKREAASALGVARNTLRAYEIGKYPIPRYIWLATLSLSAMKAAA